MNSSFTRTGAAGIAMLCALAITNTGARAGQTYVCADGTSVSVELKDLERVKRENACVGAYYKKSQKSATSASPAAAAGNSDPVLKPRVAETARNSGPQRLADFRNVRIINAAGGKPAYYRHTR